MDKNQPLSHHDVEKLSEALARKDVAYLFIGKGAAVLHGFYGGPSPLYMDGVTVLPIEHALRDLRRILTNSG